MYCVIYSRFSSDNQREESITAQLRACRAYAEQQGYAVIQTYTDEARSATTDDRPAFLAMIADITQGRCRADIVLVHKLDRFARNRYDSAYYKRELRKAGCRIESVLERLDDSPESVLMESVIEGMAEYYSKNLARETMKGMKENALQGRHTGGRCPLGYCVDERGHYQIDETTAPAIRLLFQSYARGESYKMICDRLNAAGYRTATGGLWRATCLPDILRNEKYAGVFVFNRSAAKVDGKRNHHRQKTADDIIRVPGAIPTLVDAETWQAVQARMEAHQSPHNRGRNGAKVLYLLSGLIYCGECGERLVGASSSYHTRVSQEWRQRNYYSCRLKCGLKRIQQEEVEAVIMRALEREVLDPENMREMAHNAVTGMEARQQTNRGEGPHLQQELRRVEERIANLVQAIASAGGANVQALIAEIDRLEQTKATLRTRLDEWDIVQHMAVTEEHIYQELLRQRATLLERNPLEVKRIVQNLVARVTVTVADIKAQFALTASSLLDDCAFIWWRRGESNPRPKTGPRWPLRA